MQKKLLIIALIPLYTLLYTLAPVHAASPKPSPSVSPSPSPSAASDVQVTDSLKARLQETLSPDSSASPSADANRAYVGKVTDVINGTIVMEDKDGKKDIKIGDDTVIVRTPGNAVIKEDSVRIDDSIIAIGVPAETDVLTAKRLIVSTTPFQDPAKSTAMGTIKKMTKSALTLTVGDKDQVLGLSSTTVLKTPSSTIALTDLSIGDTVIYTALNNDDGSLSATIIMRTGTTSITP